jgi:outer membrane protein
VWAFLIGAVALTFNGCISGPPGIQGVPAVSPSAAVPWPPPTTGSQIPVQTMPIISLEQASKNHIKLTLADVMNIALNNNPATKAAWADARAAAARYGSSRGAWFPSVNLSGNFFNAKDASSQGQAVTEAIAAASLSYLLFDFGGRSAAVEESRQTLLDADWTQNAVIRNTALQVEVAFFSHVGAITLLEAHRTSLEEAAANLTAAEERHRLGLATKADVLQARTAYAEIKLAVQSAEGQVRTTKGALAVAAGYPANTPFDIETEIPEIPEGALTQTVDQLIQQAISRRPDLQASRAQAREAEARVKETRSRILPALSAAGTVGQVWLKGVPGTDNIYSASLLLQVPVFNGFSHQFDLMQAKAAAEAARERTRSVEQAVTFQVFSAHSDFLTACERVKTTNELVTSAQQSEEVALGRYKEGVGNILDLLSAQRVLAMARAEQINARLSWFITLAQLAHDVGVLGLHGDNPLTPADILRR